MDLLFCTRVPDLSKLYKLQANGYHVVFMRENLAFDPEHLDLKNSETYSSYITAQNIIRVRELPEKTWKDVVDNEVVTDLSHYEYYFCNSYTAVYFWELEMRRAILDKRPEAIWISESITTSGKLMRLDRFLTCLETLNAWMLNRSLLKIARESGVRIRRYPDKNGQSVDNRKYLRHQSYLPSLLAIERLVSVGLPIRLKALFDSDCGSQQILVIAQKTKTLKLEQALFKEGVDFKQITLASVEHAIKALSGATDFFYELRYSLNTDSLQALIDWITDISLYHDNVLDQKIGGFLSIHRTAIIVTDSDYSPVVRRINKYIRKKNGYTLIAMPEGGFDMARQPSCETYRLESHGNLIKCILSKHSADRLERNKTEAREILVIGYDTSLILARILGRLIRSIIKLCAGKRF